MESPTSTVVLLGDPGCGKSTFLARLKQGKLVNDNPTKAELLRDSDQPFVFEIRLKKGIHRLEVYDTSSPEDYSLLRPDVIVLCYDINDRKSLDNVQHVWRKEAIRSYKGSVDNLYSILLGLKRDLRVEAQGTIYPQEGLRIAQEMRCARYAECSALTSELTQEAFEEITRLALAKTSGEQGSEEPNCTVM